MSNAKRKYAKVQSATKRTNVTGSVTYWVLNLDCGHTEESVYSKNGWRNRTKPAPTRVVCHKCQSSEGVQQ